MARKPAKRTATPRKKRTSKGVAGQNKALLAGAALVALLVLLVSISVLSLSSGDVKETVQKKNVPEKSENASSKKAPTIVSPQVADNKNKNMQAEIEVGEQAQDIAAMVRLVLYDFEISRTAVDERVMTAANGKSTLYFNIKSYGDIDTRQVLDALKSVLNKNNYKVSIAGNALSAEGRTRSVEVSFIQPTVKQQNVAKPKAKTQTTEPKAHLVEEARPVPPAPSDILVKVAILLDDGGSNIALAERFAKMKYPLALAVLPHLKYSAETARVVASYRKNVFLHFPMEPKSYPSTDPGEGAALLSMPEILIDGVARANFENLGIPVDGVNNHMGSALTEDPVKMAQIMNIIKRNTNVFVDSRTTPNSVAYDECMKAGLKCGINKRFLDNDNDVNAIIAKIYEAGELAKKNGEVLVIGHLRKNTLDALDIALPILEQLKIVVVPVTTVVK